MFLDILLRIFGEMTNFAAGIAEISLPFFFSAILAHAVGKGWRVAAMPKLLTVVSRSLAGLFDALIPFLMLGILGLIAYCVIHGVF